MSCSRVLLGCLVLSLAIAVGVNGAGEPSAPGGAGHALLFADHAVVLKHFKNFAKDSFTFEAWLRTSDWCNRGAIMSYAKNVESDDDATPFNHFVVFDELNVLACHDYKYIDLRPDIRGESCNAAWKFGITANFVERTPTWHHIAVTWTKEHGLTKIYKDGLFMAEAETEKSDPLESDGAFMLGNEQDCYGGCTDSAQAFYGLMDEVRLWKTARTQDEILTNMRQVSGLENHNDLIAYWKFNDPDEDGGIHKDHLSAKDSSGNGNDLPLVTPPERKDVTISKNGHTFSTGALTFANNYALQANAIDIPLRDLSVELWARTSAYTYQNSDHNAISDILDIASHAKSSSGGDEVFVDDAIRIEKYYNEFKGTSRIQNLDISTNGSISIHINGNTDGNGERFENWLDYAVGWTDDQWHHIAVTWSYETGALEFYFDGQMQTPYWRSQSGEVTVKDPNQGGVEKNIASQTERSDQGSLVLGQDQECHAGCFSPQRAYYGDVAGVRIWNKVISQSDVQNNMFTTQPSNTEGLAIMYNFAAAEVNGVKGAPGDYGKKEVKVSKGNEKNNLILWGDGPMWEYSTAPLMESSGKPVQRPFAGTGGHAMFFNDQQVLMRPNFKDFPTTAITVEFWMWSVDTCRDGVPFSYAVGGYEKGDNSFLIFNYRNWGISVMEDEGHVSDHFSGTSAVDGKWHHVAVTWESSTGQTILYDNGKKVWVVTRGQGKELPSGGTLVLGREQDCLGGCFDSMSGSTGKVDTNSYREYGPQDFFGVMDEMRIWKTVRTQQQIQEGMRTAMLRAGGSVGNFSGGEDVNLDDRNLVAYWDFDRGTGYVVKDITNHGHDLIATSRPDFQVVRWLAECGNGVVEGYEECDVGSRAGGNGCSSDCKIEDGWDCTKTSPSVCTALAPGQTPTPRPPPPPPRTHDDDEGGDTHGGSSSGKTDSGSGGTSSDSSGLSGWAIFAIVMAVVLVGTAGGAYVFRDPLSDNFPQFGEFVDSIKSRFQSRSGTYGGLDNMDGEENTDLSPDFLGATGAPQHQGSYQPLGAQSRGQP